MLLLLDTPSLRQGSLGSSARIDTVSTFPHDVRVNEAATGTKSAQHAAAAPFFRQRSPSVDNIHRMTVISTLLPFVATLVGAAMTCWINVRQRYARRGPVQ